MAANQPKYSMSLSLNVADHSRGGRPLRSMTHTWYTDKIEDTIFVIDSLNKALAELEKKLEA